ncbi:MAG: hypothetical protein ACFCVB_12705 [Nodosilinea sp.]
MRSETANSMNGAMNLTNTRLVFKFIANLMAIAPAIITDGLALLTRINLNAW